MGNEIDRITRLIGGRQASLAQALHLSERQVSRMATGASPVPEYVRAIAELLEALPAKDWPARWRNS